MAGGRDSPTAVLSPPLQGEDPLADSALTFMDQTSALTYAPAFREERPMGHPLQTLSRPQPDDLSPKGDRRVDKRNVLGQLMFYLAYRPPSPTKKGPLTPYDLMRMPWREPQKRLSPPEDPNDAPGPEDGEPAPHPALLFLLLTPPVFLAPSRRRSPTASGNRECARRAPSSCRLPAQWGNSEGSCVQQASSAAGAAGSGGLPPGGQVVTGRSHGVLEGGP